MQNSPRQLFSWRATSLFLVLLSACLNSSAKATHSSLDGRVTDSSGAVIVGAKIKATAKGTSTEARTGSDGRFHLGKRPAGDFSLTVSAPGFATVTRTISPESRVEIVLLPARVVESVVVTPTRAPAEAKEAPESINVISAVALVRNPALALDDALRQIPGFTLFRRSGSRTANPTAQGLSLRGVGASGASCALVIEDGEPLNDPFGGWVYWQRIPKEEISSIEVMQGGSSQLYGADALSGVVNIIPKTSDGLSVETSLGSEESPQGSF